MVLAAVNKYFKMWLWVLTGLNIITKVHGYGDGNFEDIHSCTSMLPKHGSNSPQSTGLPFEIIVSPGIDGDPITVTLQSKHQTRPFRGFMLQARKRGSKTPVGKFIPIDPDTTHLLRCNGSADSAVSQSNNQIKTSFQVNWTSAETDSDIFFRVTFVEYFQTFWEPVDENIPPQTTPPNTTASTELSTTASTEPSTTASTEPSTTASTELSTTASTEPSTTASTELSTTASTEPSTTASTELSSTASTELSTTASTMLSAITSTEPSTAAAGTAEESTTVKSTAEASMTTGQAPVIFNQLEAAGIVAMTIVVFLVGVKMVLPSIFRTTLTNNPFSRDLIKVSKITCSLLCAAVEFSAMVLFCVAEPHKVTLIALVCVVMVINFIELVILCLPIGPSHELKEICDITVKVCSVIHQIFTIAVIFVGVMETENCRTGTGSRNRKDSWLLKVMVAYTVWILLFVIWDFVISTQRTAILGRSKIGSPKWSMQQKEKLSAAEVIVTVVSVVLLAGNLCFTVAVAVGIFGCQEN